MARYKFVDMSPRLLPVVLEDQLVPGSFAHAVHQLLERLRATHAKPAQTRSQQSTTSRGAHTQKYRHAHASDAHLHQQQ
jgi:hypothetical protein